MAEIRILKAINFEEFNEMIDLVEGRIHISSHAYFRLSEMQRKIYKESSLRDILTRDKPVFIGLQKNKNYAAFFSTKEGYLRIMFKVKKDTFEVVTFYITDHIPKI